MKVLTVITTSLVPYGGLATVALNYYRNINTDNIIIDFASTNDISDELLNELTEKKSKYFKLGNRKKNLIGYLLNLKRVISNNSYDIIHVHGNSATMFFELQLAKMLKIKKRIAHGHTVQSNYPALHRCLESMFRKSYTDAIAVSEKTGKWLFKNNYVVLNNAINTDHYRFDINKRKNFRKDNCLEKNFVVGNVGKLNVSKNHIFLLKLFAELKKNKKNAKLLIVGGGELEKQLKEETMKFNISEDTIFLGMQDDISESLQAMDIFVFTSKFEGFGMSVIEAQASGLACVISDAVPVETKVSDHVSFLPLSASSKIWIDEILRLSEFDRNELSQTACTTMKKNGYDISCEAHKLESIYKNAIR